MVDGCYAASAFCVCAALLAVLLRQYCREQSMLTALGACAIVTAAFVGFLQPVISEIRDIFYEAGISEGYLSAIFKATAICFITQLTRDVCADAGENAIASAAETWGRGAIALTSLPLVRSLIERINELLTRG